MRVAFLNRAPQPQGGDGVAMQAAIAALSRAGVHAVQLWGANLGLLREFDIAHIFHLDFHFCRANFEAVRRAGVPYVLTPIYYGEFAEMSHSEMLEALWGAAEVLPFSQREGEELRVRFDIASTPVPNGTDPAFHAEPSPERRGVCVSDWGCSKRSDVIERACAALGLPFGWARGIPAADMPGFYRQYRVFATATTSDRMSLSVGEALCSGCRVLASDANRGNGHYPGLRTMPAATTEAEWAAAIREAHEAPQWDWRPNEAARRLTWDGTAAAYKAAYERALNG